MTEYLVADIAVEKTLYHFDRLYSYIVPEELSDSAAPGCRALISFGAGRLRQGMIMSLRKESDVQGLKSISSLLDREPVMNDEMLYLAVQMKERCFCTLFDACSTMLPTGLSMKLTYSYFAKAEPVETDPDSIEEQTVTYLKARKTPVRQDRLIKALGLTDESLLENMYGRGLIDRKETVKKRLADTTIKMVTLINDEALTKPTPSQSAVMDVLRSVGDVSKKELCYFTGVSGAVVDNLVKKGICMYYDEEPPVLQKAEDEPAFCGNIELTPEQQNAFLGLLQQYSREKPSVSLLYGITGSGKTSVFMRLIDKANEDGRGVICMVPEISLTPQLLSKFSARYGNRVAVFHSGLSLSKRLEQWKRVKNGEANIAVGTRSAIFAPVQRLGLIVMDEEQEYSYKSGANPRFHARELAKLRAVYNNCLLLLSSATPSLESYYNASRGRYSLYSLTKRYGSARLPHVVTVDMNLDRSQGNTSDYSSVLLDAVDDNLRHGQQSIILLNRRGHNTFVACRVCGDVISCPNCSISLTYHSANNRLMCHYCGYSIPAPRECPSCHSDRLRYSGAGTQKAEQELYEIFPSARILRLDTDSTMRRYSYERKLKAFRDGEYDIMLGTQMVAKGLDFENVTLVGVLSADAMLHGNDFRSYERTFSLLTQVVGRSGRGGLEGRAIIQTYEPENPIIDLAARQDYGEFYDSEIVIRRSMLYPPFSDVCVVVFTSQNRTAAYNASVYFSSQLTATASSDYPGIPMRVLGPSPAAIARVSGKYRYRLIIKFKNGKGFRELMSRLLTDIGKNRAYSDVNVYADIDPDTIP